MATSISKPEPRLPRHWYQSGPLVTMRREFEELLESFWDRQKGVSDPGTVAPRLDMSETDTTVEVQTDLPGIKADEVAVELRDNCLIINAEHQEEVDQKPDEGRKYHRIERRQGRFSRSIWLPCPDKESKVKATLSDGVLTVTLPKCKDAQTHRVPVQVS